MQKLFNCPESLRSAEEHGPRMHDAIKRVINANFMSIFYLYEERQQKISVSAGSIIVNWSREIEGVIVYNITHVFFSGKTQRTGHYVGEVQGYTWFI